MQRPASSLRSVLAGFGGLLLLMACLAVDSYRQTRDVSMASTALRHESRTRDALLDQLRTDTYRSATLVRDYMLEHDDVLAASQKGELQVLRSRVEKTLDRYAENAPEKEKAALQTLQQHAQSYWTSLAPPMTWNRSARLEQGEVYLRTTIIPRRDEMVQFVKQVNALDERVLDAAEGRIQVVQARFQNRVETISMLALAIGLILAVVVVHHTRRLGLDANTRFNEVLAAREDLRRLSDRLVAIQEEERRSISRELHDELGQAMSAMLIELGKLDSTRAGTHVDRTGLASVRRLAEDNVAKVRNMALLLRPAMLDELGLIPALRWHAREVARRTGLKVKMIAAELNDDLPDSYRTCVFRVVQEALNNCVKHAQAREVRVVIHRDGEGLSICVQDDGGGFDPAHSKGLGLLGMMERVNGLGGQFHIQSQPGHGTILSIYFLLENSRCKPVEESVA